MPDGFAANLLRFANSAVLARPTRAKTIRQALTMVGRRRLDQIALAHPSRAQRASRSLTAYASGCSSSSAHSTTVSGVATATEP